MRALLWFREKDLRVRGHEPLAKAAACDEVIPIFISEPGAFSSDAIKHRPHRTRFLVAALDDLKASLRARGSDLLHLGGHPTTVVPRLVREWHIDRVFVQRSVDPRLRSWDDTLERTLGSVFTTCDGETLVAPGTLRTQSGAPYAVFTAFARAFYATRRLRERPSGPPRKLPPVAEGVLRRAAGIGTGIAESGTEVAGERAATSRMKQFLRGPAHRYADDRNRLDEVTTSRLSQDLAHGSLAIAELWWWLHEASIDVQHRRAFAQELLWREFAYSTLWDRPELTEEPFRTSFQGFPWRRDARGWEAWVAGKTGYPIVDAASRQLLLEGFVPNRARMITASFLTKHLLLDYRAGEAHFYRYLMDADVAQNNMNWQWCAGSGCDAQPYFRMFHPVTQGERYDPKGAYVGRYVPELAKLSPRYIHRPWEAPDPELARAGVRLGRDYPRPIVDHAFARKRYLDAATRHLRKARSL